MPTGTAMISGAIGSDVRYTLAIGADRHLMPSSNETSADRPMVVKRTPRRAPLAVRNSRRSA